MDSFKKVEHIYWRFSLIIFVNQSLNFKLFGFKIQIYCYLYIAQPTIYVVFSSILTTNRMILYNVISFAGYTVGLIANQMIDRLREEKKMTKLFWITHYELLVRGARGRTTKSMEADKLSWSAVIFFFHSSYLISICFLSAELREVWIQCANLFISKKKNKLPFINWER